MECPSLTILYPGSKIESFELHSFWFGCFLQNAEGESDVAVECEIDVAGFRNGQEVATASSPFSPIAGGAGGANDRVGFAAKL